MKINIVGGNGIMGQVHKPVFERAGHEVIVTDRVSDIKPEEAAKICDLTIISVPISVTEEVIKKIAPYCKAIMDFTGLKKFPVETMLKYSPDTCEVGGLHPLYGNVSSIKNKTVIYCPTEKSREKCNKILEAFEDSGANIEKMSSEKHDLLVSGISQNARRKLLEAFGLLVKKQGISEKEFYNASPSPTQVLLDLLARQIDENNDKLYKEMADFNSFQEQVFRELVECLIEVESSGTVSDKL
ncbi:MAG: prephenate dehydrogenase/arogenate dehydrogenase family protein, partial [Candidatus Nanoarchaeia archaeon]